MKTHLVSLLFLVLSLAGSAHAQMMNDYLDVGIVTVKPEKRAEFEPSSRRWWMATASTRVITG